MKNFLSIIGGLFLGLLVAGACMIAYAAYHGRNLDTSSQTYVEAHLPVILSTWSTDELIQRASPHLLQAVHRNPEQINRFFHELSSLGAFKSLDSVQGDSHVSFTAKHGTVATASFEVHATFENGEGDVIARLIQVDDHWRFLELSVDSPVLSAGRDLSLPWPASKKSSAQEVLQNDYDFPEHLVY